MRYISSLSFPLYLPLTHALPDAVPWMLNVGRAYAELKENGPHAVVPQPDGIWSRAQCTKCRGMLPELGASPCSNPFDSSRISVRAKD